MQKLIDLVADAASAHQLGDLSLAECLYQEAIDCAMTLGQSGSLMMIAAYEGMADVIDAQGRDGNSFRVLAKTIKTRGNRVERSEQTTTFPAFH